MDNDQRIYPDDLAQIIKEKGKKHYRPSNGTEGMMFMERWCDRCAKSKWTDNGADCQIIPNTMLMDSDDEGYPPEWTFDEGQPCCTAFEEKDPTR
jgi:hypothetical protein